MQICVCIFIYMNDTDGVSYSIYSANGAMLLCAYVDKSAGLDRIIITNDTSCSRSVFNRVFGIAYGHWANDRARPYAMLYTRAWVLSHK